MFNFYKRYCLRRLLETLAAEKRELVVLKMMVEQLKPNSYYIDRWISAEKRVALLEKRVKDISNSLPKDAP